MISNHHVGRLVWCARVFVSTTSHGAGLQPRAGKKEERNGGLHGVSMHDLLTYWMSPERRVAGGLRKTHFKFIEVARFYIFSRYVTAMH